MSSFPVVIIKFFDHCHRIFHCFALLLSGGHHVRSTRTTQLAGTEKALKHEYDDETEQWKAESIWVRLSPTAIAEVFLAWYRTYAHDVTTPLFLGPHSA